MKKIVYALLAVFLLIFVNGFLEWGGKSLLFFASLLFIFGTALLFQKKKQIFLWVTGISSLGFSLTIFYGVFGIWGYYEIYDPVYLSLGIISGIGFMVGITGVFLKK